MVFPSNRDILDYVHRYAATFDLTSRIRFGVEVELVDRSGTKWRVVHSGGSETFDRVVVASGSFHTTGHPCAGRCRSVH